MYLVFGGAGFRGRLVAGLVLPLIAGCSDPAPPTTLSSLKAKIAPTAIFDASPSDYPKLYRKIGKHAFTTGKELAPWAALRVAMVRICDKITVVDYSELSTRDDVLWFVTCAYQDNPPYRYFVSQKQAEQTRAELSKFGPNDPLPDAVIHMDNPKGDEIGDLDEALAVSDCDMTVKRAMLSSRSFRTIGRWSKTFDLEKRTAKIVRDFKAENAYGVELDSQYSCTVSVDTGAIQSLRFHNGSGWERII